MARILRRQNVDLEIQKVAEILFARRIRTYRQTLHSSERACSSVETALARGAELANLGKTLGTYCLRVLSDYIALLDLFDALADSEGLRRPVDRHVDDAASELCRMFRITGRAEKNRVANQASRVKSEANAVLTKAIERAKRAKAHIDAGNGTHGEELDDRLPLARRGAFDRELDLAVEEAKREQEPLALVMIDVDHFKGVNDEHGHPVGDEVLLAVADTIVNRATHKGKAYRYGGEEFALLLPSYSTEEAFGLAERIRKDIEQSTMSTKKLRVTASFGAASFPDHAGDAKRLLERADAALYWAKSAGRNRVGTPEHS
jgi:diguanylate cyclase (GGDEF)-like protein